MQPQEDAIAEEVGRSAKSCWVTAFVTEEINVEIKSGDKDGWLNVRAGDATVTTGELDVVVEGAPELTTLDVLRAVSECGPQRGAARWPCVVLCMTSILYNMSHCFVFKEPCAKQTNIKC